MDQPSGPNEKPSLIDEEVVLRGAEAIAEFIFGDRRHKRKVYYLAEKTRGIPIHRLGSQLCLRPGAYRRWVEHQEHRTSGVNSVSTTS